MVKTATKEHTKLPILNKKHQVEFFGGGFHRQISFHFKDILRKKILYRTLQFDLVKLFDHFQSLAFIKLRL